MSLESSYRRFLLAYPPGHRASRGEEMLAVLLESSPESQRRPSAREAWSLLHNGLAMRFSGAARSGVWRRPAAAAAVVVPTLLMVLTITAAAELANGWSRTLSVQRNPWSLWVDPVWPVHVASAVTFGAVCWRRAGLAMLAAWGATAVHGYYLLLTAPGRLRTGIEMVTRRTLLLAWALMRERVLLRGGLLVGIAFSYTVLVRLGDASGSRSPSSDPGWFVVTGLFPALAFVAAVLLVRHLENHGHRHA